MVPDAVGDGLVDVAVRLVEGAPEWPRRQRLHHREHHEVHRRDLEWDAMPLCYPECFGAPKKWLGEILSLLFLPSLAWVLLSIFFGGTVHETTNSSSFLFPFISVLCRRRK